MKATISLKLKLSEPVLLNIHKYYAHLSKIKKSQLIKQVNRRKDKIQHNEVPRVRLEPAEGLKLNEDAFNKFKIPSDEVSWLAPKRKACCRNQGVIDLDEAKSVGVQMIPYSYTNSHSSVLQRFNQRQANDKVSKL